MALDAAVVGAGGLGEEDRVGGVVDYGYRTGVGGCEEDEAEGIDG